MQATEKKKEGLHYEYEVKISANDLDKKVDAKLQKYSGQIKLPGFRPGKVPLKILKQKHGKSVLGEVIEEAVQESTQKLLEDNKIRPALQPKIEIAKDYDEGKDLVYSVSIESLPEFKVMDFKGLKIEKPVADVGDDAIDDALNNLASQRKDSAPVKRGAKKGDIVVIDFHGRTADDNKAHPGMHAHGHRLELGGGQFIPGFEDQLVGAKAGESVEVTVSFPKDYHADDLAGRDAIFDVDVEEVREPKESEINDEFAKNLGLEDVKALRNAIRDQLASEYAQFTRMKLKKTLLDIFDENHDFEVPQGMIDMEYQQIERQVKMENQQKGEDAELSKDEQAELKDIAVRRVKLGLVLADIGRQNNIQVADQELQQAVIREAQKYPGQEKHVFEFYSKNRDALESLRGPLFEEKTIDYILELADVTEKKVPVEELTAEDDFLPEGSKKADKKPAKKTATKAKSAASKKSDDDKEEAKPTAKKAPAKKAPAKKAPAKKAAAKK
jgi:trigger factor